MLRLLLPAFVSLLLLCGSVVAVSRAQPLREPIPDLGECSGVPCYLGITPGSTAWEDVLSLLSTRPGLTFDYLSRTAHTLPGPYSRIQFFVSGSGFVEEIDLNVRKTGLRAGDVIVRFGVPCALLVYPGGDVALRYPGIGFFITLVRRHHTRILTPESSVIHVNLLSRVIPCGKLAADSPINAWRGFRGYSPSR